MVQYCSFEDPLDEADPLRQEPSETEWVASLNIPSTFNLEPRNHKTTDPLFNHPFMCLNRTTLSKSGAYVS